MAATLQQQCRHRAAAAQGGRKAASRQPAGRTRHTAVRAVGEEGGQGHAQHDGRALPVVDAVQVAARQARPQLQDLRETGERRRWIVPLATFVCGCMCPGPSCRVCAAGRRLSQRPCQRAACPEDGALDSSKECKKRTATHGTAARPLALMVTVWPMVKVRKTSTWLVAVCTRGRHPAEGRAGLCQRGKRWARHGSRASKRVSTSAPQA